MVYRFKYEQLSTTIISGYPLNYEGRSYTLAYLGDLLVITGISLDDNKLETVSILEKELIQGVWVKFPTGEKCWLGYFQEELRFISYSKFQKYKHLLFKEPNYKHLFRRGLIKPDISVEKDDIWKATLKTAFKARIEGKNYYLRIGKIKGMMEILAIMSRDRKDTKIVMFKDIFSGEAKVYLGNEKFVNRYSVYFDFENDEIVFASDVSQLQVKKANNNPSASSSSSSINHIHYINPYSDKDTEGDFTRRDKDFGGEIYRTIVEKIKENNPTYILWIGPGKGYELFELLVRLKYYEKADLSSIYLYSLGREIIFERSPENIQSYFEGKEPLFEEPLRLYLRIRKNFYRFDLNSEDDFPPAIKDIKFDIICLGRGVSIYLKDKIKVYNRLKRELLKKEGVAFFDLCGIVFDKEKTNERCNNNYNCLLLFFQNIIEAFEREDTKGVVFEDSQQEFFYIPPQGLKIINKTERVIPLVLKGVLPIEIEDCSVEGFESTYRLASSSLSKENKTYCYPLEVAKKELKERIRNLRSQLIYLYNDEIVLNKSRYPQFWLIFPKQLINWIKYARFGNLLLLKNIRNNKEILISYEYWCRNKSVKIRIAEEIYEVKKEKDKLFLLRDNARVLELKPRGNEKRYKIKLEKIENDLRLREFLFTKIESWGLGGFSEEGNSPFIREFNKGFNLSCDYPDPEDNEFLFFLITEEGYPSIEIYCGKSLVNRLLDSPTEERRILRLLIKNKITSKFPLYEVLFIKGSQFRESNNDSESYQKSPEDIGREPFSSSAIDSEKDIKEEILERLREFKEIFHNPELTFYHKEKALTDLIYLLENILYSRFLAEYIPSIEELISDLTPTVEWSKNFTEKYEELKIFISNLMLILEIKESEGILKGLKEWFSFLPDELRKEILIYLEIVLLAEAGEKTFKLFLKLYEDFPASSYKMELFDSLAKIPIKNAKKICSKLSQKPDSLLKSFYLRHPELFSRRFKDVFSPEDGPLWRLYRLNRNYDGVVASLREYLPIVNAKGYLFSLSGEGEKILSCLKILRWITENYPDGNKDKFFRDKPYLIDNIGCYDSSQDGRLQGIEIEIWKKYLNFLPYIVSDISPRVGINFHFSNPWCEFSLPATYSLDYIYHLLLNLVILGFIPTYFEEWYTLHYSVEISPQEKDNIDEDWLTIMYLLYFFHLLSSPGTYKYIKNLIVFRIMHLLRSCVHHKYNLAKALVNIKPLPYCDKTRWRIHYLGLFLPVIPSKIAFSQKDFVNMLLFFKKITFLKDEEREVFQRRIRKIIKNNLDSSKVVKKIIRDLRYSLRNISYTREDDFYGAYDVIVGFSQEIMRDIDKTFLKFVKELGIEIPFQRASSALEVEKARIIEDLKSEKKRIEKTIALITSFLREISSYVEKGDFEETKNITFDTVKEFKKEIEGIKSGIVKDTFFHFLNNAFNALPLAIDLKRKSNEGKLLADLLEDIENLLGNIKELKDKIDKEDFKEEDLEIDTKLGRPIINLRRSSSALKTISFFWDKPDKLNCNRSSSSLLEENDIKIVWAGNIGCSPSKIIPGEPFKIYADIGLNRELTIKQVLELIHSDYLKIGIWCSYKGRISSKVAVVNIRNSQNGENLWSCTDSEKHFHYPPRIKGRVFRLEIPFIPAPVYVEEIRFSIYFYIHQQEGYWATEFGKDGLVRVCVLSDIPKEQLNRRLAIHQERYLKKTSIEELRFLVFYATSHIRVGYAKELLRGIYTNSNPTVRRRFLADLRQMQMEEMWERIIRMLCEDEDDSVRQEALKTYWVYIRQNLISRWCDKILNPLVAIGGFAHRCRKEQSQKLINLVNEAERTIRGLSADFQKLSPEFNNVYEVKRAERLFTQKLADKMRRFLSEIDKQAKDITSEYAKYKRQIRQSITQAQAAIVELSSEALSSEAGLYMQLAEKIHADIDIDLSCSSSISIDFLNREYLPERLQHIFSEHSEILIETYFNLFNKKIKKIKEIKLQAFSVQGRYKEVYKIESINTDAGLINEKVVLKISRGLKFGEVRFSRRHIALMDKAARELYFLNPPLYPKIGGSWLFKREGYWVFTEELVGDKNLREIQDEIIKEAVKGKITAWQKWARLTALEIKRISSYMKAWRCWRKNLSVADRKKSLFIADPFLVNIVGDKLIDLDLINPCANPAYLMWVWWQIDDFRISADAKQTVIIQAIKEALGEETEEFLKAAYDELKVGNSYWERDIAEKIIRVSSPVSVDSTNRKTASLLKKGSLREKAIARVIDLLQGLLSEGIITRYYLTGSLARGDLPNHPDEDEDIDFALSLKVGIRADNSAIQTLLRKAEEISGESGVRLHINLIAFGRVFEIENKTLVVTDQIRNEQILSYIQDGKEHRLIRLDNVYGQIGLDELYLLLVQYNEQKLLSLQDTSASALGLAKEIEK
jgi:hypothetical protein